MQGTIHRVFDTLLSRYRNYGIILIYHRVNDLSSDPQLLRVSPAHFDQQMDYLSRNYHPVSLTDLLHLLNNPGKMPHRCVAVTFDDGYADNLTHAKPILERYHVPATVFVTTGMTGSDREFWWDDLERILLLPEDLPKTLDLKIGDEKYQWSLSGNPEKTSSSENPEKGHYPPAIPWDVTHGSLPTSRHRVYCDLHRIVRSLDPVERDRIIHFLCTWAGIPETGRPDFRALTRKEIIDLARGGLIDIGSHGMTHPSLKIQSLTVQKTEINESKYILQQILNRKTTSFSYPFGGRGDFSSQTMKLVQKSGYMLACANFPGPVTCRSDPFAIPRYLVRDWDRDQFARNLSMWYNG